MDNDNSVIAQLVFCFKSLHQTDCSLDYPSSASGATVCRAQYFRRVQITQEREKNSTWIFLWPKIIDHTINCSEAWTNQSSTQSEQNYKEQNLLLSSLLKLMMSGFMFQSCVASKSRNRRNPTRGELQQEQHCIQTASTDNIIYTNNIYY